MLIIALKENHGNRDARRWTRCTFSLSRKNLALIESYCEQCEVQGSVTIRVKHICILELLEPLHLSLNLQCQLIQMQNLIS